MKNIVIVGPKPSNNPSQHPGGQLTAAIGIADYAKNHGYDLYVIDTLTVSFPPLSFGKKLKAGIKRLFLLLAKLSSGYIDVVILFVGERYSFFERVLLSVFARAYGVSTLFCIRDGNFINWMRSSNITFGLVHRLLCIPDHIVVQGTLFREAIIESGVPREKIVVVRNWLPKTFEIITQPKEVNACTPLKLIFVGWIVKEKGIMELFEAFLDLQSRYQLTLDIIGGGTLEAELHRRVSDLNLNGIHIHGWMSRDEIRDRLDQSHVFVLPTYFEGFPNALLEAMARGLPAVCSDVGAISDSIQNGVNGFLVPAKDRNALIKAIEIYLTNPQLVFEHSSATLKAVKRLHNHDENLAKLFAVLG